MKITSDLLRKQGACEEQVELFEQLGGDKKRHTKALYLRYADKFDWDWAARNLLTHDAALAYDAATRAARYGEAVEAACANTTRLAVSEARKAAARSYGRAADEAGSIRRKLAIAAHKDLNVALAEAFWEASRLD